MRRIPPMHRLSAVAAAVVLAAASMLTMWSASADAAPVAPAYSSQCGEPPVPDTPVNDGPEGMFATACYHHDRCYSPGTTKDRFHCDLTFYDEMVAACAAHYGWWDPRLGACDALALSYYTAVRGFGKYYYQGPLGWNN